MMPVFFQLGPLSIYSFGLMIALGVIVALYLMNRRARLTGFPKSEEVFDFVFAVLIGGFVGGRLYYIIQYWDWYVRHPFEVFAIWQGGLIFYGGMIGGTLGLIFLLRRKKIPVLKGFDFILPFVALTQGFGRLGCFLNGCCYGKACDLPWAVTFPGHDHAVHPTQLYEAAFVFIIFFFLYHRYRHRRFDGEIMLSYFSLYAAGRFVIEFFRADNPITWGLTWNQWISVAVITVCLVIYFLKVFQHDPSKTSHR